MGSNVTRVTTTPDLELDLIPYNYIHISNKDQNKKLACSSYLYTSLPV
jgi:hypothetical protein